MKRLLFAALTMMTTFAQAQVSSSDFTVKLGDFEARGQITYPSAGIAPFPTVLLIHGSTPMDMNATITDAGKVKSQIFAQLSQTLSSSGFAVVRYNKRFVSGPGLVDAPRFYALKAARLQGRCQNRARVREEATDGQRQAPVYLRLERGISHRR